MKLNGFNSNSIKDSCYFMFLRVGIFKLLNNKLRWKPRDYSRHILIISRTRKNLPQPWLKY